MKLCLALHQERSSSSHSSRMERLEGKGKGSTPASAIRTRSSTKKRGREENDDTGAKVAKRIKEYESASNYSAKQIRDLCKERFGRMMD